MTWRNNVRKVTPYTPGEQPANPDVIKLNTNENPYPPAPGVQDVLDSFDISALRKYPKPDIAPLRDAIAKRYSVEPEQVFVGIGSDDVIAMAYMTFFNSRKPILFPDITYSFYDVWAEEFGIAYETLPLDNDFVINPEVYKKPNGGIIIPNPNAPTGLFASTEALEDIVASNPESVVIIDEAYIDFGGQSMLPLIDKYDNLLVTQTFSKSRSLAGSRIGFAIGSKELIKYMQDVKYSFNSYTIDSLTMKLGVAAIEDEAYFQECCQKIIDTREWTKAELTRLGFTFPDSSANFIFASHKTMAASQIFETLKERDIFVRYFNKPRIDNYLRISIGTPNEMQSLIDALEEIL